MGNPEGEDLMRFKQTVSRLMSLLSALMLTHLEGRDTVNVNTFDILDMSSLDMSTIRSLATESMKTEIVIQWLKSFIVECMSSGILNIPAPILTRVFQELDVSISRYHAAERFSQVPFPFPYAATMDLILVVHAFVTPVVMINLFTNTWLPIPTVGIVIFFLWSVHLVAGELENPFDGGTNDFDLAALQSELNQRLQTIVRIEPEDAPRLVADSASASMRLQRSLPSRARAMKRTSIQKMQVIVSTVRSEGSTLAQGWVSEAERAQVSHQLSECSSLPRFTTVGSMSTTSYEDKVAEETSVLEISRSNSTRRCRAEGTRPSSSTDKESDNCYVSSLGENDGAHLSPRLERCVDAYFVSEIQR